MATSARADRSRCLRWIAADLRSSVERRWLAVVLASVLFCVPVPSLFAQCAMCREAIASQSDSDRVHDMGRALNRSVMFLLLVPGTLASILLLRIRYSLRGDPRERAR